MLIIVVLIVHTVVALTAARWWLRPLMWKFDVYYCLRKTRDSDFLFFCLTWSLVLTMMVLYAIWHLTVWPAIRRFRR